MASHPIELSNAGNSETLRASHNLMDNNSALITINSTTGNSEALRASHNLMENSALTTATLLHAPLKL